MKTLNQKQLQTVNGGDISSEAAVTHYLSTSTFLQNQSESNFAKTHKAMNERLHMSNN